MISSGERKQILQLLQSPQWQTVERFAQILTDSIRSDSVVAETEWETIKKTLLREGQEQGIKRLIQELYTIAKNE